MSVLVLMLMQSFKHKEMITTVSWHPEQPDVFLAGGYRHGIACWDSRTNRYHCPIRSSAFIS
jgi:WD40 repeat protein